MTAPPNNVLPLNAGKSSDRDDKGRWLRTTGRPLGAKNKQSSELMKTVRAMGPRAVEKLADALDKEEQWAILLILKYCLPAGRVLEMEGVEPDDVKAAFINGDLSADETKAIATAMEKLKNVSDLDDLRNKLAELEQLLNAGK